MIKLEAGKCYRTRGGRKVGPLIPNRYDLKTSHPWADSKDETDCWDKNGRYLFRSDQVSSYDIIAEWVDSSHIERTKRMIEVMQAYVDGKEIEYKPSSIGFWRITENPGWYWDDWDYRIAETKTPDSINWDHVAPEFKYMARDAWGEVWLYKDKPEMHNRIWYLDDTIMVEATSHVSCVRGTVDWKDSLVIRPGAED